MDFNKYYADQARGEYPVFRGVAFQHGYGIGGDLEDYSHGPYL